MDERKLVQRILERDEAAFQTLYDTHRKRLERTAIHFLGNDPQVQDVVQETFEAALPKLKDFEFRSTLFTWLNRFTINFCLQALKRRRKVVLSETKDLEHLFNASKDGYSKVWKRHLMEAVDQLEPKLRQVVVAKDLEGRTFVEVAGHLQLAPGTVMSRLYRAHQVLKEKLLVKKQVFKEYLGES